MSNRVRSYILPVAAILALTGAAYYAGSAGSGRAPASEAPAAAPTAKTPNVLKFEPGSPQLTALRITAAEEAPLPLAEPLNGRVAYNEDTTARISSPIAGRITSLKAVPGDRVNAGALLATIDAPDFAAAVADLRKAEADELRKKLAMERVQKLFDGEVVPRKDLESAAADQSAARAETQRAQMRLRNLAPGGGAGGSGTGLALVSPVSGVIADRKANPQMEVQPGMADPLFVVSDLRKLWVLIDMPERYLNDVRVGRSVSVAVDAYPKETFLAKVARIGQVVDATTRRIQVRCDVENADGRLKPEMFARVTLLSESSSHVVRVPNSALVTEGLFSFSFIETSPGVFTKRKVQLAIQDRENAYVTEGIAKGERVVVSGALLLQSELASGQ